MNIFVGLGNPGKEYEKTRHNAGFLFVEYLAKKWDVGEFSPNKKVHALIAKNNELLLAKPQTFMNDSGKAVAAVMKWYGSSHQDSDVRLQTSDFSRQSSEKLSNLFIAYDDLDIEFGKFKIQFGSGPKVHNGLNSIHDHLGDVSFWNIRIGIDGRHGDRSLPGHAYVLQPFSSPEYDVLVPLFEQIEQQLKLNIIK